MSLKAFHVFFILISFLLLAGFGGWAIHEWSATHEAAMLGMGAGAWVLALGLAGYGAWFLKKIKEQSL